jgi:hypothetical protein
MGYMACVEVGDVYAGFWWGKLRESVHLEDLGRDERIILKEIFKNWDGDWIAVAQDWDRWRALMSAVMNLLVPQNAGNFLTN